MSAQLAASKFRKQKKTKGVSYFDHFPHSFISPYGPSQGSPSAEVMNKRLNTSCCEWLTRPGIALSELASTLHGNVEIMKDSSDILAPEITESMSSRKTMRVCGACKKLDVKSDEYQKEKKEKTIRKLLMTLYDKDSDLVKNVDRMITVGSAMYCVGIYIKVARHVLGDPKAYAAKLDLTDTITAQFKANPGLDNLVEYLANMPDKDGVVPGATNSTGGEDDNMADLLAQLRAQHSASKKRRNDETE